MRGSILLKKKGNRPDFNLAALLVSLLLILLLMSGCTVDDPGYMYIEDDPPVNVLLAEGSEVMVVDSDGDIVSIDEATRAITIIEYEHHQIHGGDSYTACKISTHGLGASPNILFVTNDTTKWAHLIFQVISDAVLQVDFYELPDYSGGGALTSYNRDRNSNNLAGLVITSDAVDDGGGKGTLIWTFKAGANKTVTASESARFEFILKQNTKYLLEAVGANGDLITVLLDWYEYTNH